MGRNHDVAHALAVRTLRDSIWKRAFCVMVVGEGAGYRARAYSVIDEARNFEVPGETELIALRAVARRIGIADEAPDPHRGAA